MVRYYTVIEASPSFFKAAIRLTGFRYKVLSNSLLHNRGGANGSCFPLYPYVMRSWLDLNISNVILALLILTRT